VIGTTPFEEIHGNPEAFAQTVQKLTAEDLLAQVPSVSKR
jgi:hypothetical protein